MRLGLRELRRTPGRFWVPTASLTLLVVLALLLGGLLDGLFLGSTGALRAQQGDVIVYSSTARQSLIRSRLSPEVRAAVEAVDGVGEVGGLGVSLQGARVPGEDELADVVVAGYELAPNGVPAPLAPGQAHADRRLEAAGVELGDVLEVGPAGVPVEVVDWVEDTSYLLQGTLWTDPGTWREVQSTSRPDDAIADGVFQALVVRVEDDGPESDELAAAIDEATGGATESLTKGETVRSLPGVREQDSTFTLLINTALFAVALVTSLYFALLVVERTTLLATLKAVGARTATLLGAVVLQAVVLSLVALAIGGLVSWALTGAIPEAVPVRLEPDRALTTGVLLVVTAATGAALSVRRIARIDPASAIG